jgi:hypothetical protein
MKYDNYMIRKIAIYIIFFSTLNGCVQGVALLGPAFSYSQSGNIIQSALSYGSNVAFKKMKNKTGTKNNRNAFDDYGTTDNDYSFLSGKNKIENSSNIKN